MFSLVFLCLSIGVSVRVYWFSLSVYLSINYVHTPFHYTVYLSLDVYHSHVYHTGVCQTGVYQTGVYHTGVYQMGVYHTCIYQTGVYPRGLNLWVYMHRSVFLFAYICSHQMYEKITLLNKSYPTSSVEGQQKQTLEVSSVSPPKITSPPKTSAYHLLQGTYTIFQIINQLEMKQKFETKTNISNSF